MNLVRYTHVQQPRLRYTVAYNFTRAGDTLEVNYGIAQCSKADTFTRAVGRTVAQGRLTKGGSSLYAGTLTVKDTDGLNVSKLVRETFEARRRELMTLTATSTK